MNKNKPKFFGRKQEVNELEVLQQRKIASFIVVKGRRRIGKSRLIEEFAKGQTFIKLEGLAPTKEITAQMQRDEFSRQLSSQLGLPKLTSDDWGDLLQFLAKQVESKPAIVLLDEISWMASEDPTFLAKLKVIWESHFSKNNKLMLILCGSISIWIDENILSSTAYFGRIAKTIVLRELSLLSSNQLLNFVGFKGSAFEKLMLLSLTGGIPWYIELISSSMSANDNIQNLCFKPDAPLVGEYNRIFHDLFNRRGEAYKKIISFLATKTATYQEISENSAYKSSGALSQYLNELESAGFVQQHYNWDFKTKKETRTRLYRLKDNYLRFYLKYIEPRLSKIQEGQLATISIANLPGWNSIVGLQFENIVLNNRKFILEQIGIDPNEIVADNPYWQKENVKQKGCQIDYLIQTKSNTLIICEIKFSRNPITKAVIADVQQKIKTLSIPKGFAVAPVLIYAGALDDSFNESDFFWKIINLADHLGE